jgi:hypothetical protein
VYFWLLTKVFGRAYGDLVFEFGGSTTMAHFELQPESSELQQLAEQYWQ